METMQLLKLVHEQSIEHSSKLKFNKTHPHHLYVVALYGSLIELCSSLIKSIDSGDTTAVPILFRSFLEAHVDFSNLCRNATYGYRMQASYLKEWISVLREARSSKNPFLQGIAELDNLDGEIDKQKEELNELIAKGYEPLSIRQKFGLAGMEKVYNSMYNFMCTEAHNNIRALISRHIEISGDDFTVVYFKQKAIEEFLQYIDGLCAALIDASLTIHGFLGTEAQVDFETLKKRLEDIRATYQTAPNKSL